MKKWQKPITTQMPKIMEPNSIGVIFDPFDDDLIVSVTH
jgi:hypothetical protein